VNRGWFTASFGTTLAVFGLSSISAASGVITRADHFVTSSPGIRIYVREVKAPGNARGVPVLLVHGGSPPGEVVFDLAVEGYSLAEDLAKAGHPAYIMDVRGWGKSTWPAVMQSTDPHARPAVPSSEAIEDIAAVVTWIKRNSSRDKVALLGHATGGHWVGMYTARHNADVSRLIMVNSMYGVEAPWPLAASYEDPRHPGEFDSSAGAYRVADAASLLAGWNRAIPTEDKSLWRDPRVAETYVHDGLESDPESFSHKPPAMRIPGAFRNEHYEMARGRKFWDAKDITVATLYIRGGRDHWSRPEDLEALKRDLTSAPASFETIPDGTHFVFLDRPGRGRSAFLKTVFDFLK
jgi:pimeloyl-ACP methyl ester carboxylesterase